MNRLKRFFYQTKLHTIKRTLDLVMITLIKEDGREVALHIQCFMRITNKKGVLFSTNDIYRNSISNANDGDFDWTEPFSTRFDDEVKSFLQLDKTTIKNFHLDNKNLVFKFENDYAMEIITDTSVGENFRVFIVGDDNHFVC